MSETHTTEQLVTDAHLAERFAAEVLRGKYAWERKGWRDLRTTYLVPDEAVIRLAEQWLLSEYRAFLATPADGVTAQREWKRHLSASHVRAIAQLAKGLCRYE